MAVYVDMPKAYPITVIKHPARKYGSRWCHMWSDNEEELHALAKTIGLKREWFQKGRFFNHYDVTPHKRNEAILRGAIQKSLSMAIKEKLGVD